jgi:hypothetical protein
MANCDKTLYVEFLRPDSELITHDHCDRFALAREESQAPTRSEKISNSLDLSERQGHRRELLVILATADRDSRKKELAAPVQLGHGLRGGRWPGPIIVRDGESCYRVREPWFSRSTKQGDGRFGGAGTARRRQGLFR